MKIVPITVIVGLASSVFIPGCGDPEAFGSPASVFRASFGVDPDPSIMDLRGEGRGYADSTTCYLKFRATRPTLDRLLGDSFADLTAGQFGAKTAGATIAGPSPSWWTPLAGSPTVFLESANFHPPHARGKALVSYDPASQVAYMYWDGSD